MIIKGVNRLLLALAVLGLLVGPLNGTPLIRERGSFGNALIDLIVPDAEAEPISITAVTCTVIVTCGGGIISYFCFRKDCSDWYNSYTTMCQEKCSLLYPPDQNEDGSTPSAANKDSSQSPGSVDLNDPTTCCYTYCMAYNMCKIQGWTLSCEGWGGSDCDQYLDKAREHQCGGFEKPLV
jgi:hypothetical protein